ncbi:MAG: type II toxin-antitoxin system MqsA family antitoxin [Lachnospiraceae bacterium]|jgi:YgiT-type zinc finger domain-containing protein|nr:type II toxin-antitoxin system MqsA family antitoxin [Lachnospiraceae bacterium]
MCLYCREEAMLHSTTTHVVTLDNCIIVIKNVPCDECVQCGEKYYSDEVMEQLETIISKAKNLASDVFVTNYNSIVA